MKEVEFNKKLLRIIEEAGEVIQAYAKAGRFGWTGFEPLSGKSYDNRKNLLEEIQQLKNAILDLPQDAP